MDHKVAVYGVDVAKAKLAIGRYAAQEVSEIGNTAEPITAWLAGLPVGSVIAMEATGGYHQLLAHLAHAAGMIVFVLNPQVLKHYGRAVGQRGKTDRVDAQLIARYVVHEYAKLRAWQPAAPAVDALSQLLVRRQALVNARQMLAQSLQAVAVLKRSRQTLLAQLKAMIGRVDLPIATALARVPALAELHRRLTTIVGVGPVLATQLVVSLNALCFTRVSSFIAYTGLDPRPDDSGTRQGVRRLTKRGHALLRCLLYTGGMAAARSKVFKPLYLRLRARGLESTEAIVILARKLARIAFALYKSGDTFSRDRHLRTT